MLLVISPYRGRHLAFTDSSRFVSLHHVISALGLEYRGIYPAYALDVRLPLEDMARQYPDVTAARDLRSVFPAALWPDSYQDVFWAVGGDGGMAFAIHHLWKATGTYTLNVILQALQGLHLVSIAAAFCLLSRWQLKGAAFLGAAVMAYSPLVVGQIFGLSVYVTVLFAAVIVSAIYGFALAGIGRKNWALGIRIALALAAGLLLGAAGALRSTSLYLMIPLAAVGSFVAVKTKQRREAWIPLVLLIAALGVSRLIHHRMWTPEALAMNQQTHLAPWHVMWIGLGEFPNPHGFIHDDEAAFRFAQNLQPNVAYYSAEYLQLLRRHIMSTMVHNPLWFLGLYVKRVWIVAGQWMHFVPLIERAPHAIAVVVLIVGATLALRSLIQSKDLPVLLSLLPLLSFLAVPILIISTYDFYNLPAYWGIVAWLLYGVLSGWREIQPWKRRR